MTVEEVFQAALDQPHAAARTEYLRNTCGDDAAFRQQVEDLLAAHFRSGEFLDVPAAEQMQANANDDNTITHRGDSVSAKNDSDEDGNEMNFLKPSSRSDSLGRIGHYEVLQILGKGGFGIVFRAFDDVLQRVVAVKVMAPLIATTSPARKRFLREARTSAAVRHENVVQVYEVGETPLPYLVMEFIPGETLQQRLDRSGPLDVTEILRIGRQIAEGLAAAHATDLIHRDIKPANVLLEGGQHKVKITDFGLARAADDASISQSGIIAGTPMYMAPEQALGNKLDQRADLFSLGSVLYQMAAGRPPFRANSTVAVLKRVAEDTPRPIREIIPETPGWLCNIISKLHAKNPEKRYQSARDVADVLADCDSQLKSGTKLKDFSRIPRGKKASSGNWKWAAVAVLLPAIALASLEFAGLTQFLNGKLAKTETIKPADVPSSDQATQETPPLGVAPFSALMAKEQQDAWARHLKIEPMFVNSIGMKMQLIPPGKFLMGSREDELGHNEIEPTQHEVTISKPFYLANHPVTVGQFKLFVLDKKYKTDAELSLGGRRVIDGSWVKDAQTNWLNPGFEQTDDHPVICISWNDAKAYCEWLSDKERKNYVLPSESQWEYACRAGSQTRYYFGDNDSQLADHAWYQTNSDDRTHPVASLKPNPWGLFDMHGNVFQWTMGVHGSFTSDANTEQADPKVNNARVTRGSSWGDTSNGCRSAVSGHAVPNFAYTHIGFRVAIIGDLKSLPTKRETQPSTFKNTLGMEFVNVPKGKSWLGGGKDRLGQQEVEMPADFYMGKYAVTQEEWEKVMGENPSFFSRMGGGNETVKDIPDADLKRFPVDSVSWDMCQIFVAKLNKLEKDTGWVYRLPKEVEWEYACRGGPMVDKLDSAYDFYFSKPTNKLMQGQTNFNIGTIENPVMLGRTRKVGIAEANSLGLFDMHGNLWAWCDDPRRTADGAVEYPIRGGSWDGTAEYCSAVSRSTRLPSNVSQSHGLRLARVPTAAPTPASKPTTAAVAKPDSPPFKNTINMEFVKVPKGKSWLGGKKDAPGDREVAIPADFYIGKYEVTQDEWEKVMGENPCQFSRTGRSKAAVMSIVDADLKRYPVENVSWDQCQVFVELLNKREKDAGFVYRLPTEAEWEYACRGGPMADKQESAFDFYLAKPTNDLLPDRANFNNALFLPSKVGSYEANRLGLHDMHGNVWEWCDDSQLAADGSTERIHRGGSYAGDVNGCRAAFRHAHAPGDRRADRGLRLVRVPLSGADLDGEIKRIAVLPAADQVEQVRLALKKRNPEFDGTLKPIIEKDTVVGVTFNPDGVTDIVPIRYLAQLTKLDMLGSDTNKATLVDLSSLKGLQLTELVCSKTKVQDLAPLVGMPLTVLYCDDTKVSDLSPLKGLPLTVFSIHNTPVVDITPLKGMQLTYFGFASTKVTNLAPLAGMPLAKISFSDAPVEDLSPLKDTPLQMIHCARTKVADLSPLKSMKQLSELHCEDTKVTDLSPLKDIALKELICDFQVERDAKILRGIKTLMMINEKEAAEFWKDVKDK